MMAGRNQIAIMRTVATRDWFQAMSRQQQNSCLRLHDRGYLDRDPVEANRYSATPRGVAAIRAHDDAIAKRLGDDRP